MISLKLFGLIAFCALIFSVCDSLAAFWAKSGATWALVASLVLGPLSYLAFGYINTRIDLAVAGGLVNALIIAFTAIAGVVIFRQEISLQQIVGLALIVTGVVLVLPAKPTGL